MDKELQVHILPTDVVSQLGLYDRLGLVTAKSQGWDLIKEQSYIKPQHIYSTSDEEIKEGDWFVVISAGLTTFNTIGKFIGGNKNHYKDNIRKIVATTNSKLWGGLCTNSNCEPNCTCTKEEKTPVIAKISDDFIEAYMKAYNEGKPITEVMVEYEEEPLNLCDCYYTKFCHSTHLETGVVCRDQELTPNFVLALNPDGTVIIKPLVEKMYSRANMKSLAASVLNDFTLHVLEHEETVQENSFNLKQWFNIRYPE
jgi:hypothetical protein